MFVEQSGIFCQLSARIYRNFTQKARLRKLDASQSSFWRMPWDKLLQTEANGKNIPFRKQYRLTLFTSNIDNERKTSDAFMHVEK